MSPGDPRLSDRIAMYGLPRILLTDLYMFPVSKKDHNYEATRLHFENLAKRYGNPIIILNLIKVNLFFGRLCTGNLVFSKVPCLLFCFFSSILLKYDSEARELFQTKKWQMGRVLAGYILEKFLINVALIFCFFICLGNQQTQERKPRESILRAEFANAIEFINKDVSDENRLRFLHWDLHKHSRRYVNYSVLVFFLQRL